MGHDMSVMIVNAATGEVVERDRTPAEQTQFEADQTAAAEAEAEREAKAAEAAEAIAAAIEHAKSLGFTDAMIAVMYPNLGA
jgi:hypothetical protein